MANSIIDDVFKEPISDGTSKKGKKKKIIFLILFLVIIVIIAVFIFFYFKKRVVESKKTEFLGYLKQSNIVSVLEFESFNELNSKIQSENSKINSEISISYKLNDSAEVLSEIDDVQLKVNSDVDVENKREYMDLLINYASNDLLELEVLKSSDDIAVKSDEIVTKYVGTSIENIPEILEKIFGIIYSENINSVSGIFINQLLNTTDDILDINISLPDNFLDKYIEVLNQCVDDTSFSSENVTLKEKNIDVIKYNMSIPESKMKEVAEQLLKTLKTDSDITDIILPIMEKINIDEEGFELFIDQLIEYVNNINVDDNNMYTLSLCVYNDRIERIILNLADYATIDIEYVYEEKGNSIKFTVLENKDKNGISINFKKSETDISENYEMMIDMIENNKTNGGISLNTSITNTQNQYDLDMIFKLSYLEYTGEIDINNNISFESVEVPELTDEICLFIDELDEEQLKNVVLAIQEKIQEVYNEKVMRLLLINNSTQRKLIEQPDISESENQQLKEEAKQKLISAISTAMKEVESQDGEYVLSDVENLIIPDAEYSIVFSKNIAIITIDGFEFKLDSEFNLSE